MRLIAVCLSILFSQMSFAQAPEVVTWSFDSEVLEDNVAELTFTAEIKEGWVVYGLDMDEDGPVSTSFEITELNGASLDGATVAMSEGKTEQDELFMMEVTKYNTQAIFKQKIKLGSDTKSIKGYLTFMTCDGERCLPPADVDFSFDINE